MTSVTPLFSLLKSIFQTVGTTLQSCSGTFLMWRSPPCHHQNPAQPPALMTQQHHWQQLRPFPDRSVQSVQSLRHVRLFVTPRTAARQASLSFTDFRSLLKPKSTESVMPSNHLLLCRPLLLPPSIPPSIRVFSNEPTLCIRWQSTGVSASASVLPMNTQDWSPLGRTGWISLPKQPKRKQV